MPSAKASPIRDAKNSTTAPIFVDSNVLVYVRDSADKEKQRRAEAWMVELWRSRRGRLSTQVLTEFYVNATQKLRPGLDRETARADVRGLSAWQPVMLDSAVFDEAWRIQDRIKLSFWDALIVGTAQVAGCRYVLTEDLQHAQEIAGVRIVSPFVAVPSDVGL
ncbi:MAG: PIN domain-containing protein [Vicinamibacterales bacterium]